MSFLRSFPTSPRTRTVATIPTTSRHIKHSINRYRVRAIIFTIASIIILFPFLITDVRATSIFDTFSTSSFSNPLSTVESICCAFQFLNQNHLPPQPQSTATSTEISSQNTNHLQQHLSDNLNRNRYTNQFFSPYNIRKAIVPKDSNNKYIVMKAWKCHGRNQKEMVDRLVQAGIIKSWEVQSVMYQVDRANYASSASSSSLPVESSVNPPLQNEGSGVDGGDDNTIDDNPYYHDRPQPIGSGQTISAPHMHAHAFEEILPYIVRRRNYLVQMQQQIQQQQKQQQKQQHLGEGENDRTIKILDVGTGSGYLTACFGRLFQPKMNPPQDERQYQDGLDQSSYISFSKSLEAPATSSPTSSATSTIRGRVYGIDIHNPIVDLATANIRKEDNDLFESGILAPLQVVNGWEGLPSEAPFDAIHVGAAAETFPVVLAQQLRVGGVLIVPIGPIYDVQSLFKVERVADSSIPISDRRTTGAGTGTDSSSQYFDPNDYEVTELLGVRYVPLIGKPSVAAAAATTASSTTTTPSSPSSSSSTSSSSTLPPNPMEKT
jgi:protein-L-isoaspartate(D-aspartate) O-methyltransferase